MTLFKQVLMVMLSMMPQWNDWLVRCVMIMLDNSFGNTSKLLLNTLAYQSFLKKKMTVLNDIVASDTNDFVATEPIDAITQKEPSLFMLQT